MNLTRIENVDLKGKIVFLRVDFNVPIENGKVTDTTRIDKTIPTIEVLQTKGAKIILVSHLGRPDGERKEKYSLKPIFDVLQTKNLGKIVFSHEIIGESVKKLVNALNEKEILLLENIRFEQGEETNDATFSKKLADLADVYVNDAFGAAHRAHASTEGIAHHLPSYAGLLMYKEIKELSSLLVNPKKPFVAIIGGSKISTKIKIIENLFNKVDTLLIGGGMAYTFLKSRAIPIGRSLYEKDYEVNAFQLIEKAGVAGVEFLLPTDHVIADEFKDNAKTKIVDKMGILDGWMGMDIGPKTISAFEKAIKKAGTILWNGPMGVFEMEKFANGTMEIAKAVAKSKAKTIVGGGDSISAINKAKVFDQISHVSTGGGASLEFLEGRVLPGVKVLTGE